MRLRGREGTLGLGVHLGWVGFVARVEHEDSLLLCLLENERDVVVDGVDVGAANRPARERVSAEHRDIHVVEHRRRYGCQVGLADVTADGLEVLALALERRGSHLLVGLAAL